MLPEKPAWTFREGVGGVIACLVIGAICWSALTGSAAAETALVGAAGAVTGWLFRGSGQTPNGNGNGYPPGSAGSAGSAGSGGGGTATSTA